MSCLFLRMLISVISLPVCTVKRVNLGGCLCARCAPPHRRCANGRWLSRSGADTGVSEACVWTTKPRCRLNKKKTLRETAPERFLSHRLLFANGAISCLNRHLTQTCSALLFVNTREWRTVAEQIYISSNVSRILCSFVID